VGYEFVPGHGRDDPLLPRRLARIDQAKAAGLAIGIGSDWSPSSSKNLLGELKVARLLDPGRDVFKDRELVALATRETVGSAARVLSLRDPGGNPVVGALSLAEGKDRLEDAMGRFAELARALEHPSSGRRRGISPRLMHINRCQTMPTHSCRTISTQPCRQQASRSPTRASDWNKYPSLYLSDIVSDEEQVQRIFDGIDDLLAPR
jgi:hypothetical protein